MILRLEGDTIHLEGEGRVEDAETLLTLLQAGDARRVDLSAASHLHTAILQVLLALRPPLAGMAGDPFAQRWLVPLLVGSHSG
jgi:hypothetical protein